MTNDKRRLRLKFRDLPEDKFCNVAGNFYLDQLNDLGSLGFVVNHGGMRRTPIVLAGRWCVEVQPGDYIVQYAGVDKIAAENRNSIAEMFIRVRLYAVESVDDEKRTLTCEVPEVIPGHLKFESGKLVNTSWIAAEVPEIAE